MAISNSTGSVAAAEFHSNPPGFSLPPDITTGRVIPHLASRFRAEDLLKLSSVSKGFYQACQEWRAAILFGWRDADNARTKAEEIESLTGRAGFSSARPGVDHGARMLLDLLDLKPAKSASVTYGEVFEPPALLQHPYSGFAQVSVSTEQEQTAQSRAAHAALSAYAMLQRLHIPGFGRLPPHLMLVAMCAALEEGQGEPGVAAMLGRIDPDGLIAYLRRRVHGSNVEPDQYVNACAFVDFAAQTIACLPQGVGRHAKSLMLVATLLWNGPADMPFWDHSRSNLKLMNAVLGNLHKLAAAGDQYQVLCSWLARFDVVTPRLRRVLSMESKNFPKLASGVSWQDLNFKSLLKMLETSFLAMNAEDRTKFLSILQKALALKRLPEPDELKVRWDLPLRDLRIAELKGLFENDPDNTHGQAEDDSSKFECSVS